MDRNIKNNNDNNCLNSNKHLDLQSLIKRLSKFEGLENKFDFLNDNYKSFDEEIFEILEPGMIVLVKQKDKQNNQKLVNRLVLILSKKSSHLLCAPLFNSKQIELDDNSKSMLDMILVQIKKDDVNWNSPLKPQELIVNTTKCFNVQYEDLIYDFSGSLYLGIAKKELIINICNSYSKLALIKNMIVNNNWFNYEIAEVQSWNNKLLNQYQNLEFEKSDFYDYDKPIYTIFVPNEKRYNDFNEISKEEINQISKLYISKDITSINNYNFSNFKEKVNIYYCGRINDWCNMKFSNRYSNPMIAADKFFILPSYSQYDTYYWDDSPEDDYLVPMELLDYNLLKKIIIPKEVTQINDYQFAGYKGNEIIIPNTITSIGTDAFFNCKKLKRVYFDGTIEEWCKINFSNKYSNPIYYAHHFYLKDKNNNSYKLSKYDLTSLKINYSKYHFVGLID